MPTASGTLKRTSSTTFKAEFTLIDGSLYKWAGTFRPPITMDFESNNATLEYDQPIELGSRDCTGEVGVNDVYISLYQNGEKITGALRSPMPSKRKIDGGGSWSTN